MCVLFAPSAVSVVLCPVVVPFVSLRLSSVSSVLRDCQTMVLCQACGLLESGTVPGDAPCTVPTDGVLPCHLHHGLCRRCMVARGHLHCIGDGREQPVCGLVLLSRDSIPYPVQHFCPIASLRCGQEVRLLRARPCNLHHCRSNTALCYFNLSLQSH